MPAPSAKSLTLASTGPTLVVGNGALIESIDPASGRVVARIKPVDVADLTWKRLDRRGRFLLAEGWSGLRKGPIPYFDRGLVLFDDTGAVLWARTQAFPLNGFTKTLDITGVGYRAQSQGKTLRLQLGYSHDVNYDVPEGIEIKTPDNTTVEISGIDKQKVGQVAAEIRRWRKPEPYKGKGIKYRGEYVFRKEGKKK